MSAEIAAGLLSWAFMWEPNNLLHALIYFLLYFENEIYFMTQSPKSTQKNWEKKPMLRRYLVSCTPLGLGKNKNFKLFYSLGKGMSFTHKSLSMPNPGIFWMNDLLGQFMVWVPPTRYPFCTCKYWVWINYMDLIMLLDICMKKKSSIVCRIWNYEVNFSRPKTTRIFPFVYSN
jgi:hypothetical protein